MENPDIHDEIDQLAAEVEQTISQTESFMRNFPDFAPRSARSKKMRQAIGQSPKNRNGR